MNYDNKGKLSFYPVVDFIDSEKWDFGQGLISPEMIYNYMPSPSGNDMFKYR